MWSDWLVVCNHGFSLSALWCPLSAPAVLLVFLLPWTWGSFSRLLQLCTATACCKWSSEKPMVVWDLPTKILLNFSYYLLSQLLYQVWFLKSYYLLRVRNSTNLIAVPASELQQYPVLLAEREWFNPIFLSSYELSLLKDKLSPRHIEPKKIFPHQYI